MAAVARRPRRKGHWAWLARCKSTLRDGARGAKAKAPHSTGMWAGPLQCSKCSGLVLVPESLVQAAAAVLAVWYLYVPVAVHLVLTVNGEFEGARCRKGESNPSSHKTVSSQKSQNKRLPAISVLPADMRRLECAGEAASGDTGEAFAPEPVSSAVRGTLVWMRKHCGFWNGLI